MGRLAIHVTLLHDWEGRAHLLPCKCNDLFVCVVLLGQELRTWESHHLNSVSTIFLVYVDQLNVAFMSEGSLRRQIYNYRQFKSLHEFAQFVVLAFYTLD